MSIRAGYSRAVKSRISVVAAAAMLLAAMAGCQRPVTQEKAQQPAPDELAPLSIAPGSKLYLLDPAVSWVKILVYRDGRLAQMGHNHVISSEDLRGEVYLSDWITESAFEIRMPVAKLVVDRPELRAEAGADFPGALDPDAVDGTRANMLSSLQLDAVVWPEVLLRSRVLNGELPDLLAQVSIVVKGQVYTTDIPLRVSLANESLLATGRFMLRQTDLGMEPFSVMMGALKVRDELEIEFYIVARPGSAP